MVRSIEWNESTQGPIRPGAWPVDELYAAYADDPEGHLMIPHVGGRRCVLDWHHPELERLVELGSAWGQFHWLYAEALQRGYRVGASANSDEHQGRCGGGVPATAVFGSRGGLTGIVAERFDRIGVAMALRARRTFATTGERSHVSLKHGHHWMGEIYRADPACPLDYRLLGDQGWEAVSLYDAEREVWSRNLHAEAGYGSRRIRLRLGGARIKDRYRGAWWRGSIAIVGAAVLGFEARGFDHPEQTCWRQSEATIGFRTETSGDQDTIEIDLSQLAGACITLKASIDGYVKVGDALHPPPHVHAPMVTIEVSGEELITTSRITRELSGAELHATIERVTELPLPREVRGQIQLSALDLAPGREHPLYITARQRDQSRIWSSALFATLPD